MWKLAISALCFVMGSSQDRPVAPILIEGLRVSALFDSGSEVTAISWQTFCKLKSGKKILGTSHDVNAANGSKMTVMGQVYLNFVVGSKKCFRPVLVIKGMMNDFILGADTMQAENILLDMGRKKIICKKKRNDELKSEALTLSEHRISPGMEKMIECQANVQRLNEVLITGKEHGIEVTPSVWKITSDQRVFVPVLNAGNEDVVIKRNQGIADVENFYGERTFNVTELCSSIKEQRTSNEPITENHVDLSGIPEQVRPGYLKLLNVYRSIFSQDVSDIGRCNVVKHKLILKDQNKVANVPQYPIPYHLKHVALKYVEKLLAAGIIRPSTSPFNSPLLLVKKPHVTITERDREDVAKLVKCYRVCHDFRILNKNLVMDSYPLLNLTQLVDEVSSKKIWSVIDLSSGFWQQELDETSKPYTAFGLSGVGHFEYEVTPQGIATSTSNFQRLLDHVCRGLKDVHVYVDDILCATMTHAEMLETLASLFARFKNTT